jgi:hypothetical protein
MSQANEILRAGYSLGPGTAWTEKATAWPTITVARKVEPDHMYLTHQHPERESVTAIHICCSECPGRPSVFCLSPDIQAEGYRVTAADIQAGILAHIRRSHDT